MDELWIQVLAGTISGLIVTLVQTLISRGERSPEPAATNHVAPGAALPGVDQAYIDRRIQDSPKRARSKSQGSRDEDAFGEIAVVVIGALIAAGLFVSYYQILFAIEAGLVAGLVVSALVAMIRTRRTLAGPWPQAPVRTLADLAITVAVAATVWDGVFSARNGRLNLPSMGRAVGSGVSPHTTLGSRWSEEIAAVTKDYGFHGAAFAVSLLVGVLLSLLLVVIASVDMLSWHAYIGLGRRLSGSALIVRRARAFREPRWRRIAYSTIVGGLAVLLAWGLIYDVFTSL